MSTAPIPWKHVRNILVLFAPLWVGATIFFGAAGLCYALFRQDTWASKLPIVVRDEANTSVDRLGRFASQTELKAAQETLLEMTQNPAVVRAALKQVGPPNRQIEADWPSTKVVAATIKKSVNLLAPQGSEFGNTDVVYLQVKASSKDRSVEFCRAMFDNLTEHLRTVRRVRADSMINELTHARNLAKQNLDEASSRMREVEIQFGADLGELRNLNETISGDGTNRRSLESTVAELQAAELDLERLESLHRLLVAGAEDPQHLLISGGDLLSSQPSLQRLKAGLIDAQLSTSQLSGSFTDANPKRRAALATEKEIKHRMRLETSAVILAMEPKLQLERQRVARLQAKKSRLSERLGDLAEARLDYAAIDAEVRHRTELLAEAERHLTDALATRSAALSTNLIAELGTPQVTENPVGPGGSTLVGGSTMAGLIFGLGMVFLVAPGPSQGYGRRRWSDYLGGQGRRATDAPTGAASQMQPGTGRAANPDRRAPREESRSLDQSMHDEPATVSETDIQDLGELQTESAATDWVLAAADLRLQNDEADQERQEET